MTEKSAFWDGIATGDHGPYSDEDYAEFTSAPFVLDNTDQFVLHGIYNELLVSLDSLVPSVASGAAFVNGFQYINSSAVELTSLVTPAAGTNYYTIVLRCNTTNQVVRAEILGPDAGAYPTVTQAGATWEMSLATISVSADGTTLVTDTRVFCLFATRVDADMLEDDVASEDKFDDTAVSVAKLAAGIFPETTKGDLKIHSGVVYTRSRLAVGADDEILMASSVPEVEWETQRRLIEDITLSAATNYINFTALPANAHDLYLRFTARADTASNAKLIEIYFNDDNSSGNYRLVRNLASDSGYAVTYEGAYDVIGLINVAGDSADAGVFGSVEVMIPNFASAVAQKEITVRYSLILGSAGSPDIRYGYVHALWMDTSAITKITVCPAVPGSNNFMIGSTFALYGEGR